MALEVKLGQDLRLRQQLVMTPQLQQAIKILQLSLPELEAVVQSELDANPMLEPLDQSVAEGAANSETNETSEAGAEPEPLQPEPELNGDGTGTIGESDWDPVTEDRAPETVATEAPDATVEIRELNQLEKLDWREYLEDYSNNWQGEAPDSDDDRRQTLENTLTRKSSLEDHLMWQLRMSNLDELDQRVGATIIYHLSDDGYLETPLEELADLLGGVVGVSRVVTSEGWRPHKQQVGQTGTKITPELYLACGISGAIQHIAGCAGAKHIIAINTDPGAPILAHADYAVIGDLHQVIPALVSALRSR